MASGVKVAPDVKTLADAFNKGPERKNYAFLAFKVNDAKTEIVFDVDGSMTQKDADMKDVGPDVSRVDIEKLRYKAFMKKVQIDTPRWYLYDGYKFMAEDAGREKESLVFIHWCPDEVPVKQRMLYASSKDAVKKVLGISKSIEASDFDEISHENILALVN